MLRRISLTISLLFFLSQVSGLATLAQSDTADDGIISRICLVLNSNRIDDGTFNQSAYEGMQAIVQDYMLLEDETTFLPSESADDHAPNIQQCIDEHYDIIITVGFPLAELTYAAAEENPDRYFIGVDQFVADGPQNYVGIQFREDEAGFLIGYLAGLITEERIIAGVYGPPIPPVVRWRSGFEQGVRFAAAQTDRDLFVLGKFLDGFDLVDEGADTAAAFIRAGVDVIFGAGGSTGSAAIQYAAAQGIWVIGVDQDEYYTTFGGGTVEGANMLITSGIKRVNVGVYDMLAVLLDGNLSEFPGGSNYILTVENSGISYANPHDAEVPLEYFERLVEVETMLADGEITTGVDPVTGQLITEVEATAEADATTEPEATEVADED